MCCGTASHSGARHVVVLVLTLLQVASGLSNVVLGWPLAAALGHTAGAAALVGVLSALLARAARGRVGLLESTALHVADPCHAGAPAPTAGRSTTR